MNYRFESDTLGKVQVPEKALYGAQTVRAKENFPIGDEKMPADLISAYGYIKKAAAIVNNNLGLLSDYKKQLIIKAADGLISGELIEEFPLPVWQTGSGTQTNMNVNEVISNKAAIIAGNRPGEKYPLHPNDDVNMSQSSNDTFPTAMAISTMQRMENCLLPILNNFEKELLKKAKEFQGITKVGRTHLMDATPITCGQEFATFAAQINEGRKVLINIMENVRKIPIGGTAVGTGLNTKKGFAELMVEELSSLTGMKFYVRKEKGVNIAAHDNLVAVSGSLKTIATSLMKIANDIRWMASGPRAGLAEIMIPANEPGSSIMPGKINPTQAEALYQVCVHVMGNDLAISFAGSSGNFQLNVCKPVIIYNLLQSIKLLADGIDSFTKRCLSGITVNKEQLASNVKNSLMLVTALNPVLGYDKAAEIAKLAQAKNISLKKAALNLEYLTADEFDELVKPIKMANPH